MPKIKFLVEHREVDIASGRTIREVALEAGIYLNREFFSGFNCGGRGLCGTCKVWVRESSRNATSPPNFRERFHGMGDGRRLACQTRVFEDIEVTSMPGGQDRLEPSRIIDPAPQRPADPEPPAKAETSPAEKKAKDTKPKDDKPKGDKPKDDKPKDDKPKDDKPKGDEPKDDKPKGDEPKDDKSKDDKPKDDKPKDDKPKDDNSEE